MNERKRINFKLTFQPQIYHTFAESADPIAYTVLLCDTHAKRFANAVKHDAPQKHVFCMAYCCSNEWSHMAHIVEVK